MIWPESLPQEFISDGFERTLPDNRLRTAMDVGPAKVRRRSSQAVSILNGSMLMTDEQRQTLDSFVRFSTGGGTLPFTFPDPWGGSPLLVRFGEALPSIGEAFGDQYLMSIELEVLP